MDDWTWTKEMAKILGQKDQGTQGQTSGQEIVREKTNILLRYFNKQWDKKAGPNKGLPGEESIVTKKALLETIPDTSNTTAAATSGTARPAADSVRNSIAGQEPAYTGT